MLLHEKCDGMWFGSVLKYFRSECRSLIPPSYRIPPSMFISIHITVNQWPATMPTTVIWWTSGHVSKLGEPLKIYQIVPFPILHTKIPTEDFYHFSEFFPLFFFVGGGVVLLNISRSLKILRSTQKNQRLPQCPQGVPTCLPDQADPAEPDRARAPCFDLLPGRPVAPFRVPYP